MKQEMKFKERERIFGKNNNKKKKMLEARAEKNPQKVEQKTEEIK